MKVAIVTFELEGLTRNGGIGTAYRRLAELLVARGDEVTVVFLPIEIRDGAARGAHRYEPGIRRLRRAGVRVVIPRNAKVRFKPGDPGYFLGRSGLVCEVLRAGGFDLVHAPDNCGLVYVSLLAKKSGSEFRGTTFVIGAHGPRIWGDELNGNVDEASLIMTYFDRSSIAMADRLVSPSRYMIGHLRSRGWALPEKTQVIPNVNALGEKPGLPVESGRRGFRPKTLVFFGRLEPRKGVHVFAEAIEDLLKSAPGLGVARPLEILFLGKDPDPGQKTIALLRRRLAPHRARARLDFKTNLSSAESLELLSGMPRALVCIPSLSDNSPYVLVEAIELGLDVLSTRSGGQAELVDPRDRSRVLCDPDAKNLSRAIARRLSRAPVRARPSRQAREANLSWLRFHSALSKPAGKSVRVSARDRHDGALRVDPRR